MAAEISEAALEQMAKDRHVSPGELAALKLALRKRKSKDIAKSLAISESAARKRLGEVYRKFEIGGRGPGKLASLEQKIAEQMSALDSQYASNTSAAAPLFDSPYTAASAEIRATSSSNRTIYHWGSAPRNDWFQGREEEIETLAKWILAPTEATKLLAVCGIGGIGKTCFSVKLAEKVGDRFQQVVWLSIDKEQPPEDFLRSLLAMLQANASSKISLRRSSRFALSSQRGTTLSARSATNMQKSASSLRADSSNKQQDRSSFKADTAPSAQLIQQLVLQLSLQRALVVLDGFEAAFKETQDTDEIAPTFEVSRRRQSSVYKAGFEIYGRLLEAIKASDRNLLFQKRIASSEGKDSNASSCLILTSQEKPREVLSTLSKQVIRTYSLSGLSDADARAAVEKFSLKGSKEDYRRLSWRYNGHPMALLLAAGTIQNVFSGNIQAFLDQDVSVFDDLRSVLKAQFKRLPLVEKEVMYWLAVNQRPCIFEELKADIVSADRKANLLYILRSLEQRSLIEVAQPSEHSSVRYQLHPIVLEYMLDRFVREMFCDLVRGDDLSTFNSFALLKADAEDSLRESQRKRIVLPILERLKNYLKKADGVKRFLSDRLDDFRLRYPYRLGYAGGNFINLLVELSEGDLSQKDFSDLAIWQAYLPGVRLSESNFKSCQLDRSVFTEALGDVLAVALRSIKERDGTASPLLAAGDANGVVHLWTTNREQMEVGGSSGASAKTLGHKLEQWTAHSGWVRSLCFVPRRDYLVTGGDDNKVKLWWLPLHQRPSAAKLVWEKQTYDWIYAIAVSPDGKMMACVDGDRISLYQLPNGKAVSQISNASVRTLTFSPDGRWLAGCGEEGVVRLWLVAKIEAAKPNVQPALVLEGHRGLVHAVKFSPDSRLLVSGGNDRRAIVWAIASDGEPAGKKIHQFMQPRDRIRTLAFSPDGKVLASGGDDACVRLWNAETFELLQTLSTDRSRLWSMDFYQQGHKLLLAAGGDKQRLTLWQTETVSDSEAQILRADIVEASAKLDDKSRSRLLELKPLRTYRGYTRGIRSLAYLGDRGIIGGGDRGDLLVWNAKTGEQTAALSLHSGRVWAVAVNAQTQRIASASDDYTVRLWSAQTGQCLTTLAGHSSWVRTLSFSHHGRYLASAGDDGKIRIWNTVSGVCSTVLDRSENWIRSVAFDPANSRYLVSGGDAQVVRHWSRKENRFDLLAHHEHRICSVAYSRDGALVASGSDDATAIVWDVKKKEILHHFKQPSLGIKSVAFSPDGRYLAAGGEDQIVFVWDLASSNPDKRCLKLRPNDYTGLAGGIRSVVFSPCGQQIISGGLDEMVRAGDLSQMETLSDRDEGFLTPLIERDRPYENLEIQNVTGLTGSQIDNLLSLGAVNGKQSLLL